MYGSRSCCSHALAANDPAKHANDKEHTLPAALWATTNKMVNQTPNVL